MCVGCKPPLQVDASTLHLHIRARVSNSDDVNPSALVANAPAEAAAAEEEGRDDVGGSAAQLDVSPTPGSQGFEVAAPAAEGNDGGEVGTAAEGAADGALQVASKSKKRKRKREAAAANEARKVKRGTGAGGNLAAYLCAEAKVKASCADAPELVIAVNSMSTIAARALCGSAVAAGDRRSSSTLRLRPV